MKVLAIVIGLVVLGAACVSAADDSDVLDLNEDNFDDKIKEAPLTLVEFFAPWCGHCKALAPEYEQAATTLKDNEKVQLAKVDCTEHRPLCSKYGVRGFPTLKVFRDDGSDPTEYDSARKAGAIVSFMKKQGEPAVSEADSADAIKSKVDDDELVVVFFNNGDDDASASYLKTANGLRNDFTFVEVKNDSDNLAGEYDATAPAVVLFRKFDEPQVRFEGDVSGEGELAGFLKTNSFPLFGTIGPDNFQKYVERGFPLVWSFLDLKDADAATEALTAAAGNFKDSLSFVQLDGVRWKDHGKSFGCGDDLPCVVIEDRESNLKYVYNGDVEGEAIKTWVDGYKAGTLEPTLKSEDIPEKNDGPVTVVVGKSYEDIVLDESKDVLLEFYAPWCGHCKSLAPKYDELGEQFSNVDSVVIAKIDATANDTPDKDVKGFPTIKFYPANDKSNPKTYSGDRTAEALATFVRENAALDIVEGESGDKTPVHEDL